MHSHHKKVQTDQTHFCYIIYLYIRINIINYVCQENAPRIGELYLWGMDALLEETTLSDCCSIPSEIGPRGNKTFFMLNSTEHENFFMLINLKLLTMPNSFFLNIAEHENFSAIVGIFIFIGRENFMLSWVEHEKSFITSGPGLK